MRFLHFLGPWGFGGMWVTVPKVLVMISCPTKMAEIDTDYATDLKSSDASAASRREISWSDDPKECISSMPFLTP